MAVYHDSTIKNVKFQSVVENLAMVVCDWFYNMYKKAEDTKNFILK